MVLVGLLLTIVGFPQHRATLISEQPPPGAPAPPRWPAAAAATSCAQASAVLAAYLTISAV